MKMIIEVGGNKYVAKNSAEHTASKASEELYFCLNCIEKLHVELENGSFLVLGKETLSRCIFTFVDE